LHDISKDGRVLLSRETWRRQIRGLFPGDKAEHPYSWLDDTEVTAISADGRFISIYEAGEIYYFENNSLAYYRGTDGSPAVRLGVGTAAISPDGKWVLLASNHVNPKLPLQLQPIGPGDAKDLLTPGLVAFDHYVWSDATVARLFTRLRLIRTSGTSISKRWASSRILELGGGRGRVAD
jgi:hypothetical protein